MERLISKNDFEYYTMLKRILFDLDIANTKYWWLISDIEAYADVDFLPKIWYNSLTIKHWNVKECVK